MMFFTVICVCLLCSADSANILAVFPHPGKSHVDMFRPLMQQLAARGHRVTVLSFFPQTAHVDNLIDISLVGVTPLMVNALRFEQVSDTGGLSEFVWVNNLGLDICQSVLSTAQVKSLIDSHGRYDLLVVEIFNTDCFLSLLGLFRVPYIAISSSMTLPHYTSRIGNPDSLSYVSNLYTPFSKKMDFSERTINVLMTLYMRLLRTSYYLPAEESIVRRTVGLEVPLQTVAHNVSLLLVNSHHSLQSARPLVPGYVEVGGLHIRPAAPLQQELDEYLTGSKDGVLLFSMGSVLQSSSFPEEKRQAFMDAFAELPVRVIMKWENDTLPGKPDNVRLSKWLPQRDILAHPKIVAFMGHGGFLSTSEAVHCGVPMVLIPMFGDQPNNVAHLEATGAAVKLSYSDITKDSVLRALRAILYDPRYRENAKSLSERFRDRPMSPLDTAVYWTEYVIRHKGAPHLRSAAVDMPWYQLWLLDVILALSCGLAALLLVVFWLAKRTTMLVSYLIYSPNKHSKTD